MKNTLTVLAVFLGALFIVLTCVYWLTPANALPTYLPGYSPTLTTVHFKHGLGALIIALALFVFAWFNSGKKKSAASNGSVSAQQ